MLPWYSMVGARSEFALGKRFKARLTKAVVELEDEFEDEDDDTMTVGDSQPGTAGTAGEHSEKMQIHAAAFDDALANHASLNVGATKEPGTNKGDHNHVGYTPPSPRSNLLHHHTSASRLSFVGMESELGGFAGR